MLLTLLQLAFALMLPRGTTVPFDRKPRITYALILACLAVHVVTQLVEIASGLPLTRLTPPGIQAVADPGLPITRYFDVLALTPSKLGASEPWRFVQLLTANFVHADWFHLLFNVWFFLIFAINIEDLFGPVRYGIFIAVSLLASQLAVVLFTAGSESGFTGTHLGFSGVVYAAIGAYLVCFPRSRIRVVLITSLFFWFMVACALSPVALISALFLGRMWEVVWLLLFLGLYVVLQPSNLRFGIPALLFLGFRLAQDAADLANPAPTGNISMWSHTGGLMAGVLAGLLVNGIKGLSTRYDDEEDDLTGERARRRVAREKEATEVGESPAAQEEFLARKVWLGDAVAAVEFYVEKVLPAQPRLTLKPPEQLALARMLDARGYHREALHAYDLLLWAYGHEPGMEPAYVSAAALCARFPERFGDGFRYLNRFSTLNALKRDMLEAGRVRQDLELACRERKVDPGSARDERFEGKAGVETDAQSQAEMPVPPGGWNFPTRAARMLQLAPTSDGTQVPQEEAKTPGATVTTGGNTGDNKNTLTSSQQGDRVTVDPTLQPQKPVFLKNEPTSLDGGVRHAGAEGFDASALVSPADQNESPRFYAPKSSHFEPPLPPEPTDSAGGRLACPPKNEDKPYLLTHAVLLPRDTRFPVDALLMFFREELRDDNLSRRAVENCRGVAGKRLPLAEAQRIVSSLDRLGIPGSQIVEECPSLHSEPFEVVSAQLGSDNVVCLTRKGRQEFAYSEIHVFSVGRLKLSPQSKTHRGVVELFLADGLRRLQILERTLQLADCSVDGVSFGEADTIDNLIRAFLERLPPDASTAAARQCGGSLAAGVCFDSFAAYENYLLAAVLSGSPPS